MEEYNQLFFESTSLFLYCQQPVLTMNDSGAMIVDYIQSKHRPNSLWQWGSLLDIQKVRRRVISDDTYTDLDEIRRFRHLKRYYFDLNYDWDILELVRKKFLLVRSRVIDELNGYTEYLTELAERVDKE